MDANEDIVLDKMKSNAFHLLVSFVRIRIEIKKAFDNVSPGTSVPFLHQSRLSMLMQWMEKRCKVVVGHHIRMTQLCMHHAW